MLLLAVHEFITTGLDEIYVDDRYRWLRNSEAYRAAKVSAGSFGTSLNLLYFFKTVVSIFSIYSLCTSIFLALISDNLLVFEYRESSYSIASTNELLCITL